MLFDPRVERIGPCLSPTRDVWMEHNFLRWKTTLTSSDASRKARIIFVHMASLLSGRHFLRASAPFRPFIPHSGYSSMSHLSSLR